MKYMIFYIGFLVSNYFLFLFRATRVSPCAMILAMIYLERLQIKNSDYLESVSPSGLFVVTMVCIKKILLLFL